jgi:DNA-binding transcriptional LysR family regulator
MTDPSVSPVELDLRLVQCFTVVARHGHFGRAAAALHVTQPSLSRQIRRLEQQVGARLIDRTPRGSTLTEAGAVFLPHATALLRSAGQALAKTRAAAQPSRIVIGYTTGVIVTPAVLELRRRHPDADVKVVHVPWREPRTPLLDHQVDALVTRFPFATDRLHVTVLYDEPRVVVVPLDHRLAGKEHVTIEDIADEPLPRIRGTDPAWNAFWRAEPRPDGRLAPDGPEIDNMEDKFEIIAAGQAVAITPDILGHPIRPDLTYIPLEGVEPCHVVIATRAEDRSRLVTDFRHCAQAQLTGPEPKSP